MDLSLLLEFEDVKISQGHGTEHNSFQYGRANPLSHYDVKHMPNCNTERFHQTTIQDLRSMVQGVLQTFRTQTVFSEMSQALSPIVIK